jgi:hypothetical protein
MLDFKQLEILLYLAGQSYIWLPGIYLSFIAISIQKFEHTKGLNRSRKTNDRQQNGKKEQKDKRWSTWQLRA